MKTVQIDIDKFLTEGILSTTDIYNLSVIYYHPEDYNSYLIDMDLREVFLENNGYIKILGNELYSLRNKALSLFSEDVDKFLQFVQTYINIFPQGIKSGGYYVRSDVESVANKLRKFFKKYKYTQQQVLDATTRYVTRLSLDNYRYIKTAEYFIFKDNSSILASEIQNNMEESSGEDWTRNIV